MPEATMSEVRIDAAQVRHVAKLARLALDEAELESLRRHLASVLDYMAQLDALDVSEVEPTFHPIGEAAAWREDEVQPSLPREAALAAAPAHEAGGFAVPKVWEADG